MTEVAFTINGYTVVLENVGLHRSRSGGAPELTMERSFDKWAPTYKLNGTSRLLADGVLKKEVPIGILLDRLEECPEEVQWCDREQVLAAVRWLRLHHPFNV